MGSPRLPHVIRKRVEVEQYRGRSCPIDSRVIVWDREYEELK
jgi:hypothetical protein